MIIFTVIAFVFTSKAQEKNAIGLRLGGNNGLGAEISFQTALFKKNRLELDFGYRRSDFSYNYDYNNTSFYYNSQRYYSNDIKLVGIFQWVFDIKKGFKWYVGPGVGVGFYSSKNNYNAVTDKNETNSGAFGVIAGDGGIEYNFKFPLQLSFDVRPELSISNGYLNARGSNTSNLGTDIGLSARYRF